ncbi:MAG: metal-dependent hydrolase [Rhodospirillaceae bacterium]|nr:metal-dependent hydrolase [Rhodospirillaceae bacterium]
MDLFTQGALGAALAQAAARAPSHPVARSRLRIAGGFGFLAGMAPDLDALIRSASDPLVFLEYHRHFTHALAFIPVGALACAGLLHAALGRRWGLAFRQTFLFCALGYATHGVLDAATSYGTMLLWPFADVRIAASLVSIVDPLFTLPLAVLVAVSWRRRAPGWALAGLAWATAYLAAASVQHDRAHDAASALAAARGQVPVRVEVKPSFGNIVVWRAIAETADGYHVDAVRAGARMRTFEGVAVARLDPARDLPWLDPASRQADDIARFRRFSDGFIALDPARPHRIIDIRYSFLPNEIDALWSIEVSPDAPADAHARYRTHRNDARANLGRLWRMVAGAS